MKGNLSVNDYVLKIKVLMDELKSAGCLITKEEVLMYVLVGLYENFDNQL